MTRYLRENAELITSICVALSLVLGGLLLYWRTAAVPEAGAPHEVEAPLPPIKAAQVLPSPDIPASALGIEK